VRGVEMGAVGGFLGLSGGFGIIAGVLGAWMAWRILEKAGFPGWLGLAATLLTLTGIASIVPLVLLWVFAFMRWPRDARARLEAGGAAPYGPARPGSPALGPPPQALAHPPRPLPSDSP